MTKKTEFDDKFEEIIYYYIRNDWLNLENAIDSLEKNEKFCLFRKDNLNLTYEAIKKELFRHKNRIK